MTKHICPELKDNIETALAHTWSAHTLVHELTVIDIPRGEALSAKLLLEEAAHKLNEIAEKVAALPTATDMQLDFEAGFMAALRSVEHGMREPMQSVVSDRARAALGALLAKVQAKAETPLQTD